MDVAALRSFRPAGFAQPISIKWKNGDCNFATHVAKEAEVKNNKINPLKASKRKGR